VKGHQVFILGTTCVLFQIRRYTGLHAQGFTDEVAKVESDRRWGWWSSEAACPGSILLFFHANLRTARAGAKRRV